MSLAPVVSTRLLTLVTNVSAVPAPPVALRVRTPAPVITMASPLLLSSTVVVVLSFRLFAPKLLALSRSSTMAEVVVGTPRTSRPIARLLLAISASISASVRLNMPPGA